MSGADTRVGAGASTPDRAGIVLVALILVAAVANLNLSVANVALPDDRRGVRLVAGHAQPHRGRLLARPRSLGALPRRARRSLRPQDDARPRDGARDPDVASRGFRAVGRGALRRARGRRARGRNGLPDDAGSDHRALVRAGPDEVDRALVGARRRASPRSGRSCRERCSSSSTGDRSSSSRSRSRSSRSSWRSSSYRATSTRRRDPVDNLGGILSVVLVGALILAINFAPVPNETTRSCSGLR